MKQLLTAMLAVALLAGATGAAEKSELKDQNDKVSYSVGYQIGGDFKRQGMELNADALVKGIQDALAGAAPLLTPQEMNQTLVELKRKVMAAQQEERKKMAEKNLAEGKAFLTENSKKEEITTLPSGLQYKVIREGAGESPKKTDKVTVHYRGTLIDGTEFDSSYSRNQPATFRVDGVIPGWTEALQLMKAGARWRLFIPANLAYGESGMPPRIPPNSTLIFEVELQSIDKADTPAGSEKPPAGPK